MRIDVKMPNKYYVAFSFGGTHVNSDMVVFKADGSDSKFYDMFSKGYGEPELDSVSHYTGTASYSSAADTVHFHINRYLNTNSPQDYVVKTDWPNRIGWAVREYDSDEGKGDATTWEGRIGMHHKVGYFNLILWSN